MARAALVSHMTQTDKTFPLRAQESPGKAWEVLADKVACPPQILQRHLQKNRDSNSTGSLLQGRGQSQPLLEGSSVYHHISL